MNYLTKILHLGRFFRRAEVRIVTVLHRRRCAFQRTGRTVDCNCDPDLQLGPDFRRGDS